MTVRHDAVERWRQGPRMMPMFPPPHRGGTQTIACAGRIHAERGRPVLLDPRAKAGRARVALLEDGAAFCGSCAFELERGGFGGQ